MSIDVVCPNRHAMKVKDKYAGRVGTCPTCKAQVKVPDREDVFDDDSIMGVLNPNQSGLSGMSIAISDSAEQNGGIPGEVKKTCGACCRKVPENAHLCPFCYTYLPPMQWLSDSERQPPPIRREERIEVVCAKCHEEIPEGLRVCPHCHTYVADLQA